MITRHLFRQHKLKKINTIFQFCKRNFSEITYVKEQEILRKKVYDPNKVPKTFTSVLDKLNNIYEMDEYQKLDYEHNMKNQMPPIMPFIKEENQSLLAPGSDFRLDRNTYLDYIHNSRDGEVTYKRVSDVNVLFIGPDYYKYKLDNVKNLFKVLTSSKPDLILLQHKPDYLLDDFKYLPIKGDFKFDEEPKMKFDIDSYINQLVVSGHQIVHSYEHQKLIKLKNKNLAKHGIFCKSKYPDETEDQYFERLEEMKKFNEVTLKERINDTSMTTIGLWAISHNIPIILSDIPEFVFRKHIAKYESLIEMREMLKEACMDIILDPNIFPLTPYFGAIHRYPDLMFHYNDRYTASLIKSIVRRNPELKTIAVLCGYGQTKSLPTYLQFSEATLFDNLSFGESKTQQYFGKTDRIHNMVEKQVIYDHLFIQRDEQLSVFWDKNEELRQNAIKLIQYLVSHEQIGSPNSPEFDIEYYTHIYTMLFNNEIKDIREKAFAEARNKLKGELKRRVRDDPDLIRRIKVQPSKK